MGEKRLGVSTKPLVLDRMLHPHQACESPGWKKAARYGIQRCGDGLQVYAQPSTLKQIKSLRDALTAVIGAWRQTPAIPRNWENVAITEYWEQHFVTTETDPKIGSYIMCSLCGNHGVIDTRGRAISPKGNDMGRRNFCVCPNGQAARFQLKEEL